MRSLTALILLFFLHFTASMAGKMEVITAHHQTFKQSVTNLEKTNTFAKKQAHPISLEVFSTNIERIHQIIQIPSFVIAISNYTDYCNFEVVTGQSVKLSKDQRNHLYASLFKCLYPKHTFW